jgi:Flp pilus assembly protein TadD
VRTELEVPDLTRVENVIGAVGQRDQQQLAAFHLDAAHRAFAAERDGEAIAALRRAVYLSPYDHEAHMLLGRTFLRGGRLAEARDSFKISLWSHDTVDGRLQLASVYEKMGMAMEAAAELRAALRLDPSNVEAKQRLSRVGRRE